MITILIN